MTLAGHDPGTKNYGLAVVRFQKPSQRRSDGAVTSFAFSLLEVRLVENCLLGLKDVKLANQELSAYSGEMRALTAKHKPDAHVAERYMSRRMGGTTIELVNMTLGVLRLHGQDTNAPVKMVPASQWKNELKRRDVELERVYLSAKAYGYSNHEVDAVFIALYGACLLSRMKPFGFEDVGAFVASVVKKLSALKGGVVVCPKKPKGGG